MDRSKGRGEKMGRGGKSKPEVHVERESVTAAGRKKVRQKWKNLWKKYEGLTCEEALALDGYFQDEEKETADF